LYSFIGPDKIFTKFNEAIENPATNPLVFNVWGIGGVGKTRLLDELEKQSNISFARVYFGSTQGIATPLKLMANLYNRLPTIDDWGEEYEIFTDLYRQFEQTLKQLEQPDKQESDIQATERKEAIKKLVGAGAKTLTKFIPGVKEISGAEDKIGSIAEGGVDLVAWLQKQKVTKKNQDLQALMLNPILKLTEAFITVLIAKSREQAVVLLLDTYEKANSEIDDWLWQYLIVKSKLQSHPVRIVVAGRNNLLKKESWRKLQQDFNSVYSLEIERFALEQTQTYLENIGISESEKIYQVTKGLPYYLNWIREQKEKGKELDFSEGNQEITNLFLQGLDSKQQKIIQLAACCRWFDRALIEELTTNPKLNCANVVDTQIDCFEWLKELDFVELLQYTYRLDDVSRDVFRLSLWQEYQKLFYQVHQVIANYFEQKANDEVSIDSSPRIQYETDEWREYTAEFLYHYLFAKQPDSEQKFLSYLFTSCYFEETEVVPIPFTAITAEADIKNYQLLSSSIRNFLQTIQPIFDFNCLVFEERKLVNVFQSSPNFNLDNVKRQIQIPLEYCFNKIESLAGLAKFAALLYKAKNSPQSQQLNYLIRAKSQAETIIVKADPQFSSGLFLWDIGNSLFELEQYEEAIEAYARAIEIKPDYDSAWYNRGLALYNLGRLEEAIEAYARAIEIKPDHDLAWNNRGSALYNLGRLEEAIEAYARAIEIKPDHDLAWYNRACYYALQNQIEPALENLTQAISLNPKYRERAKTDTDFDQIRENSDFQKLIQSNS
jgi:tetratricopeptide (TPR) repeat protein